MRNSSRHFYPLAEELMTSEKDVILELHRSPRSILGLLSWAVLSLILISIICYFFGSVEMGLGIPFLSLYWLYLIPIALTVEAIRRYHDDLYLFEKERILHKGGRLSLQYNAPSVRYIDIRALSVNQSFIGRLFDYGSLEVNTAALDTGELYIQGVRAPDNLSHLIEEIRKYRESQTRRKNTTSAPVGKGTGVR